MPITSTIEQETLFNAGVDTALQISKLAKQAEYFASSGDYPMWYMKLEAWERWMSAKFRDKAATAGKEVKDIKTKYMSDYKKYIRKTEHNKKITKELNENIKEFLTSYENSLMFWRDKFGYGMPLKDDSRFALG